jgi:hypothetical protein
MNDVLDQGVPGTEVTRLSGEVDALRHECHRLSADAMTARAAHSEALLKIEKLEHELAEEVKLHLPSDKDSANYMLMRGALRKIANMNWEPGFVIAAARLMKETAKAALE